GGAHLGRDDFGHVAEARCVDAGEALDGFDAFLWAQTRPFTVVERVARGGDRPVDVSGGRFRNLGDDLFAVRRDHPGRGAGCGLAPPPTDENLAVPAPVPPPALMRRPPRAGDPIAPTVPNANAGSGRPVRCACGR